MANIKIALFKGRKIRRTIYQNEWWFSVVDVCEALTDSVDAGAYWRKLKQRLNEEGSEVVTFCHGLKLEASDGKAGGNIAGGARKKLEKRLGRSIVSKKNYLKTAENRKKLRE
jgi:hypothetical protein